MPPIAVLDLSLVRDELRKRAMVERELMLWVAAVTKDGTYLRLPRVARSRPRPEQPKRCVASLLSLQCVLRDGHAGMHRFRPWSE